MYRVCHITRNAGSELPTSGQFEAWIKFPDMPAFRPDLEGLVSYVPGRPIDEVAREIGIRPEEIIKVASNESPEGPFPGVIEAVTGALAHSNRYPDNDAFELTSELAAHLGVEPDSIWLGAGSTGLLGSIALAMGGPSTSAVYAWPSFVMYRIISRWAMTESIEVPLNPDLVHDVGGLRRSVREDTSVMYICNPNNPTGTVLSGDAVEALIDDVPSSVLVVVDEAYHEFVDDPGYRSAIEVALERPNVIVLRTFSKVYALAAYRIGYAVGAGSTLSRLRKTQAPFTVSVAAQAAASASLRHQAEVERRVKANAEGRRGILEALEERGLPHTVSQTNFVYARLGESSKRIAESFTGRGVIVRPMSGGWLRITVGSPEENETMLSAMDAVLAEDTQA